MCRLAAYLGPDISLSNFLIEHEHSLIKQAWAPKEMRDGTVNADGHGFSWLDETGKFCLYKNILPIWSDTNLDGLSHSLNSSLWLANVRGATPGQGINEANTQPFVNNRCVFIHNGCLKPFNSRIKSRILESLSIEIHADINGDSDSLYLFALLQEHLSKEQELNKAIEVMMSNLKSICGDIEAMLNIIVSNGNSLYACRNAINAMSPSLYYLIDNGSVWIASEPLNSNRDWTSFNENSFMEFSNTGITKSVAL